MKYCSVPGCKSKQTRKSFKTFFNLPTDHKKGQVDPLRHRRRLEWIKAIRGFKLPQRTIENAVVCSKHFATGQPAREQDIYDKDWVPSLHLPRIVLDERENRIVDNIIETLPEVIVQFDVPDLIILDKRKFNEKQIEMDLIHKYITNPVCDENGYYNNDHDYLGLPVLPTKTEPVAVLKNREHSYSLTDRPACLNYDSRHFCNICAFNFNNLFSFNSHMMVHTMKNDVVCTLCKQRFLTTTCLNNHLDTHTWPCDKCGLQVPIRQLKAHLLVNQKQKYRHNDILKYKIPQKNKVYFCVLCMKRFFTRQQHAEHACLHNRVNNGLGRL